MRARREPLALGEGEEAAIKDRKVLPPPRLGRARRLQAHRAGPRLPEPQGHRLDSDSTPGPPAPRGAPPAERGRGQATVSPFWPAVWRSALSWRGFKGLIKARPLAMPPLAGSASAPGPDLRVDRAWATDAAQRLRDDPRGARGALHDPRLQQGRGQARPPHVHQAGVRRAARPWWRALCTERALFRVGRPGRALQSTRALGLWRVRLAVAERVESKRAGSPAA